MRDRRIRTTMAIITLALALGAASRSAAQPEQIRRTLPTETWRLGVGLKVGSLTGLSVKYFSTPTQALETDVGFGVAEGAFQAQLSYLFHFFLTSNRHFALPLYLGPRARLDVWPDYARHYYSRHNAGDVGLGFGVPFGVSFNFRRVPMDAFAEVATGVGIVPGGPAVGWWVDGAIGARHYF